MFPFSVLLSIVFVAIAAMAYGSPYSYSLNQINDEMGNFDASIQSNQGSGDIIQGSDGNEGMDKYDNNISRSGNGTVNVNAVAGNQDADLVNDSQQNTIRQIGDGNQNANQVTNDVRTGNEDSDLNFNVANMDARTQNAHGVNQVGQINDNNNATNNFVNN